MSIIIAQTPPPARHDRKKLFFINNLFNPARKNKKAVSKHHVLAWTQLFRHKNKTVTLRQQPYF